MVNIRGENTKISQDTMLNSNVVHGQHIASTVTHGTYYMAT